VRQKVIGASVLVAVVLAMTGCTGSGGGDGNLINSWAAMPEAKILPPPANVCYAATGDVQATTRWDSPLDCAQGHTLETFFVSAFSGEEADRSAPPPSGGPGRRKAYETCMAEAKTFLGEDFRIGRLKLYLITPSSTHWEVGARWFRCDLAEFTDIDNEDPITRSGSLKGGLSGDRQLALGCAMVTSSGNAIETMTPIGCADNHNSEFAGIYVFPDGPRETDPTKLREGRLAGCRGVIAAYTGIPNDGDFQYRTGQIASPFETGDWELGNRALRCWIWSSKKTYNKSLKGVGPSGLPINYA